ncbi:MAG: hypothetical protein BGO41_14735 [Clostridiales bacterium 38-18]|nr:MAG: hypothetical protein BGO41_14735 [Clostridiales bacterium 38-18]
MSEWMIKYHEIAFYQEELIKMIRNRKEFTLINTQADSFFEKVFFLLDVLSEEKVASEFIDALPPTEVNINRYDWLSVLSKRAITLQKKMKSLLLGEIGWPTSMVGTKQRICLSDEPTENVITLSHFEVDSKEQIQIIFELNELVTDLKTLVV